MQMKQKAPANTKFFGVQSAYPNEEIYKTLLRLIINFLESCRKTAIALLILVLPSTKGASAEGYSSKLCSGSQWY